MRESHLNDKNSHSKRIKNSFETQHNIFKNANTCTSQYGNAPKSSSKPNSNQNNWLPPAFQSNQQGKTRNVSLQLSRPLSGWCNKAKSRKACLKNQGNTNSGLNMANTKAFHEGKTLLKTCNTRASWDHIILGGKGWSLPFLDDI